MRKDWTDQVARRWAAFWSTAAERGRRLRAVVGPWMRQTSQTASHNLSEHWWQTVSDGGKLRARLRPAAGAVRTWLAAQSGRGSRRAQEYVGRASRYLEKSLGTALSGYLSTASRGLADYRRTVFEPRLSPTALQAFAFTGRTYRRTLGRAFSMPRFRQSTLAAVSGALVVILVVSGSFTVPRDYARKPIPDVPMPLRLARPMVSPPAALAKRFASEPMISVYHDDTGATTYLPMETYLIGVLGGEMDPRAPLEAFAAQAIVARTTAIKAIVEKGTPWQLHRTDVCTSPSHLQAYRPIAATPDMKRAVAATRGQILMYGDQIASAVFASCCGGRTADVQESYPSEPPTPYLKSVACPCGEFAPDVEYHWRARLPLWAVGSFLDKATSAVSDLRITARGPSGRITQMTAGGRTFSGANLRSMFGSDLVRSTLVDTFSVSGSYAYATGRGWGHGVGLCQWGAFTLAKKGMKAADIVAYYYQGTDLVQLWK